MGLTATLAFALLGGTLIALGVWLYLTRSARRLVKNERWLPLVHSVVAGIPLGVAVLVYVVAGHATGPMVDILIAIGTVFVFAGIGIMTWRPRWLLPGWTKHITKRGECTAYPIKDNHRNQ
jgi:protein-S-isoprenylcysteine O-methyltransferase Ste14